MPGIKPPINAVPTNIITGFLGVGKTTAIGHLLENKPASQRWAVLVNEFGEIGVDGGLIEGHHSEDQGVFVREVPGGCMCCTAGLPMQVALNQLLSKARPDRLLIEPTGLGHPKEVLQVLSSGAYQEVLSVEQIITLVNARHLHDARYTENRTFNQQIEIADIVIGNKSDLYQPGDEQMLQSYVQHRAAPTVKVALTANGKIDRSLLAGATRHLDPIKKTAESHHHNNSPLNTAIPACGYIKKENHGDGYHSVGWRFREDKIFRRNDLFSFLSGIDAERLKAVVNTDNGVVSYNMADAALTETPLSGRGQSSIEIISTTKLGDDWETLLLQCMVNGR